MCPPEIVTDTPALITMLDAAGSSADESKSTTIWVSFVTLTLSTAVGTPPSQLLATLQFAPSAPTQTRVAP